MEHSFSVEVASEIGVNGAILLKHLVFWCNRNRLNDLHERDGYNWTYNSARAFNETFPYIKERTIHNVLQELEDSGYILSRSDMNAATYDKTKWYAVTQKGFAAYGITVSQPAAAIPVPPKPQEEPPRPHQGMKFSTADSTALFAEFWQMYPKKVQKAYALKCWLSHRVSAELFPLIMAGLKRSIQQDKRFLEGYIPNPATWINGEEWENEYGQSAATAPATQSRNGFDAVQKILDEPCAPPPKGRIANGHIIQ